MLYLLLLHFEDWVETILIPWTVRIIIAFVIVTIHHYYTIGGHFANTSTNSSSYRNNHNTVQYPSVSNDTKTNTNLIPTRYQSTETNVGMDRKGTTSDGKHVNDSNPVIPTIPQPQQQQHSSVDTLVQTHDNNGNTNTNNYNENSLTLQSTPTSVIDMSGISTNSINFNKNFTEIVKVDKESSNNNTTNTLIEEISPQYSVTTDKDNIENNNNVSNNTNKFVLDEDDDEKLLVLSSLNNEEENSNFSLGLEDEEDDDDAYDTSTIQEVINSNIDESNVNSNDNDKNNISSDAKSTRDTKSTTNTVNTTTDNVIFSSNASKDHPGLERYWYWCDTETSLYRMYTRVEKPNISENRNTNTSSDLTLASPHPYSRTRGKTAIELRVYNTYSTDIVVYWINYQGRPEYKGIIPMQSTWIHSTFIDHPFVFCQVTNTQYIDNADYQTPILHYIAYKDIPSVTPDTPTLDTYSSIPRSVHNSKTKIGIHQFTICKPYVLDSDTAKPYTYYCAIDDPVLPYPASKYITTQREAAGFALLYCYRNNFLGWNIIMKYLTKIVMKPHVNKYRKIRIANNIFYNNVWAYTISHGLFYAVGFIESNGYLEIGIGTEPLQRERVQDVSQLLLAIGRWARKSTTTTATDGNSP